MKKFLFSVVALNLAFGVDLDEIVVTGTGFEHTLKDETRNMFVRESDESEIKNYRSLSELVEKIPGVDFKDWGIGQSIDMRGQGEQSIVAVKLLFDGVPVNMLDNSHMSIPLDTIAIEDVERVEVMPGGGAVLYGGGTRGGVINVITKKRPREFFADFSAKLGSFDYHDANLLIGGNVNERLFLKFGGKIWGEDGYRDDGREKGHYMSATADLQLTDNQNIALSGSYFKSLAASIDDLTLEQAQENRRQNPNPDAEINDYETIKKDVSLKYNGEFGPFSLEIMPYWQNIDVAIKEYNASKRDSSFTDEKRGVKIKGKYAYDGGEIIVGYDYLDNDAGRYSFMNYPSMNLVLNRAIDLNKETHSAYVFARQNFGEFGLSGGYRYERANYEITRDTYYVVMGFDRSSYAVTSDKMNNHAFEITPNWQYSDTGNLYAKFERGYISPTPYQLQNKVNDEYDVSGVDSEIYNTYEIGWRDQIWGSLVTLTAFRTDTKDEIDIKWLPNTNWIYYNINKVERYGVELGAEQNFGPVKLTASYSYVRPKIKDNADISTEGKDVPYVSRHKLVVGVNYEPIKGLNLWTDAKYYSSYFNGDYEKMPSRTIVDLGANYKFANGLSLGLSVNNVFDKKYYEKAFIADNSYVPAKGRSVYGEIKYSF